MILMDRTFVTDVPLKFKVLFYSTVLLHIAFLNFKFWAGLAFINALSKSLVSGREQFSVPGKYKTLNILQLRKSSTSRSIPRLLLPASTTSPGKCISLEELSDRRIRNPRHASVTSKEALSYRQDCRSSFKYYMNTRYPCPIP